MDVAVTVEVAVVAPGDTALTRPVLHEADEGERLAGGSRRLAPGFQERKSR
jgi:hypothetical protein